MTTATSSGKAKQQRSGQTARKSSAASSQTARKSTTASSQTRSSQSSGAQSGSSRSQSHGTTVDLPFVTAQFHTPEIHLPTQKDLTSAADSVRSQLPSRSHAVFYGGLALGAAFSVIEWPVALAIGVGTALVSRSGEQES